MKNISGVLFMAFAVCCFSFKSDNPDRPDINTILKIKQEGFNNSKVMETLFQLTDANGPRLTGSGGMKSAEKWACQQLKDWGLANAAIEPWGGFWERMGDQEILCGYDGAILPGTYSRAKGLDARYQWPNKR